jgi:flagellar basal-body rod protein FlgB
MPNAIEQIVFNKLDIPRLQTVLDLTATRQRLLTENVANAETPGYERKDIDFKAELRSAVDRSGQIGMKATRPEHFGATPQTHAPKINEEDIPDGQKFGVDIDREMSAVAQNQMEYNIAARLVSRKFDALRTVIRGRR